jgi:soluble lytic murein transglycosylase
MPLIALLTSLALLLAAGPTGADEIEAQREVFRQALPHAETGQWSRVEPLLAELGDYPLLPDLRAAYLRNRLGRVPDSEVKAFLERFPALGFSAGLRRQWADSMARRKSWAEYLALYEASYADRGEIVLDCHAFSARLALGRQAGMEDAVLQRWLAPVSQPDACDPAFEWLLARGAVTDDRRRQRMELALDAGQFGLARWLARPLGEATLAEVRRWERLHANPAGRLATSADWQDTRRDRALLRYGFHRFASTDPERAAGHWPDFRDRFAFTDAERAALDRRIALLHAWRHLPGAMELLDAMPTDSRDDNTRSWAVRAAIRAQDWEAIERALVELAPATAREPVWRYWHARVLESTDRSHAARPIYAELAGERGYYSFLSADRLNADYHWQDAPTAPDEAVIASLERRDDVLRTRELFFTGLEANGRTEWQQLLGRLSPEERAQAGILASRWGWYSRSITAASGAGMLDDLALRFPLPWRPVFEERARRAGVDMAWTYGVARSESLFMPDVSSGAGAVGLMQLLPGTGRETAGRAGIRYRGQASLLDPADNIALGTTYLARMLERYENHRVLATAAYNAGPSRVDRWLPEDHTLPADAWVDTVPFNETRGYVQRVLASEAVFQWRMTGETRRISDAMPPVQPRAR